MLVILKNTNIVLQITEFNSFQIKIVMKGTNSSYPPKISDMRAIALAV